MISDVFTVILCCCKLCVCQVYIFVQVTLVFGIYLSRWEDSLEMYLK
jgi:hypothetical protein